MNAPLPSHVWIRGCRVRNPALDAAAERVRRMREHAALDADMRLVRRTREWFVHAHTLIEISSEPYQPPQWAHGDSATILRQIAEMHGITVAAIKSPSRAKSVVNARHHAMYEVHRRCPKLSLPWIGAIFGNRDHSSVHYAIKHWPDKARSLGIPCVPINAEGGD